MDFNFTFRVHLHGQVIEDLVKSINRLGDSIMAVGQDIIDLAAKIDAATNLVATEITFLQSQIKNSMTDDEVAKVKASMQAITDRLTAMGTDPNNPIPPVALAKFTRQP